MCFWGQVVNFLQSKSYIPISASATNVEMNHIAIGCYMNPAVRKHKGHVNSGITPLFIGCGMLMVLISTFT